MKWGCTKLEDVISDLDAMLTKSNPPSEEKKNNIRMPSILSALPASEAHEVMKWYCTILYWDPDMTIEMTEAKSPPGSIRPTCRIIGCKWPNGNYILHLYCDQSNARSGERARMEQLDRLAELLNQLMPLAPAPDGKYILEKLHRNGR